MPNLPQQLLNQWGSEKIPFLFIVNFATDQGYFKPLSELDEHILFALESFSNFTFPKSIQPLNAYPLTALSPIALSQYAQAFDRVIQEMRQGNTYLFNLTFPTEISLNTDLLTVFYHSRAKFKLYYRNHFITFSPERFIQIVDNVIKTFPMKGTLEANLPHAAAQLLHNPKELAEHVMIVDLLRNDLASVAKQVQLKRFRYLDTIWAGPRQLLQTSSEITGILPPGWQANIGDLLWTLLPAGSISGTPKHHTVTLIKQIENYDRGFFTGIFGYFDGKNVDSAVMIRFIERQNSRFFYKSGGGITIDSDLEQEYQELIDKIYIPL